MTKPTAAKISLLVIRSSNIERDAEFYSKLGFEFTKHQHGSGPVHFASDRDGFVFEIYPQHKTKPASTGVRLGFSVASVDKSFAKLVAAGAKIVSKPADSQWGRRAVVDDLEGHRVEIVEAD